MLDRTVAPPIVDAVNFEVKLQPYQKYILKNNVEIYSVNAGTEEVMMIEWVFYAGNWYEEKNLQASVTNFLLKTGTSKNSAFDISEQIDYYGAYLTTRCYAETAVISLHCLTKHIEVLLPIVHEIITDSVIPESELQIAVQNMKQKLDVNLKKSSFVAGRLIDVYLFGENHPYGRYSRHEDFNALTRNDLLDFYETQYRNGQFTIFAAGRLPQNINSLLENYFGDLPNKKPVQKYYPIYPTADKKHHIINDENSTQASIRIARHFYNRHHPDFLKAQVLNIILGGYFGSRLMENIREDKGFTYGIHSYLMPNKYDNGWMITTEAGRDVSEAAIAEVYKEMRLLANEPVNQEELSLVKNFMIGSILGDIDGPFQMIARWKSIILHELGDDHFDRSINNIKNITAQELQEVAHKYLIPEEFYELTVI